MQGIKIMERMEQPDQIGWTTRLVWGDVADVDVKDKRGDLGDLED